MLEKNIKCKKKMKICKHRICLSKNETNFEKIIYRALSALSAYFEMFASILKVYSICEIDAILIFV